MAYAKRNVVIARLRLFRRWLIKPQDISPTVRPIEKGDIGNALGTAYPTVARAILGEKVAMTPQVSINGDPITSSELREINTT